MPRERGFRGETGEHASQGYVCSRKKLKRRTKNCRGYDSKDGAAARVGRAPSLGATHMEKKKASSVTPA